MTASDSGAVRFLYGTAVGRAVLKLLLATHADRVAVAFLRSPLSRPMAARYIRRYHIDMTLFQERSYRSFRDFFARRKHAVAFDPAPDHLISPCDALLSVFPIDDDSVFPIKGSAYRLSDLLGDDALSAAFAGGQCLIFRLTPADYHHYHYIDDGCQGKNHFIPGTLHSVQPTACAAYPVYTLNRRSWTLLDTRHFGPVVQCEIGALIVGGIVNGPENASFRKGDEKGRFDLAGSSIALLLQKGRVALRPELARAAEGGNEVRVELGEWIGTAIPREEFTS